MVQPVLGMRPKPEAEVSLTEHQAPMSNDVWPNDSRSDSPYGEV